MVDGLKLWGLTGGIGSGKSTVARMIAGLGVPVIDADQLAREVVLPGSPALAAIADEWPEAIGMDGSIDRRRLAAIVFADPEARLRLERITHPRIAELCAARAAALARAGHRLAFYEASLLVETGRHADLDGLCVVTAPEEAQVARVVERSGLPPEEARARIAAQLPLADKIKAATHVVDNGGDLAATRAQVERLVAELRGGVPAGVR